MLEKPKKNIEIQLDFFGHEIWIWICQNNEPKFSPRLAIEGSGQVRNNQFAKM